MQIDAHVLKKLPFRLGVEIAENLHRKSLNQSELAEIQEQIRQAVVNEQSKGGRPSDGKPPQKVGEVSRKHSSETDAIVGKMFGESREVVRQRREIVQSGDDKLIADLDRTNRVSGVYRRLKIRRQAETILAEPPPLPAGPFRVIVADPPWHYSKRANDPSQRAAIPYPSMTIEEIKTLDVASLAHDDSILWLWTTNAHLPESFGVAEAWEFTYKTLLTWVKPKMGTGDWLRGKTEHCLLCVRGKSTIQLTNQTTHLEAKAGEHSQKPDEFYQLVETLCPGSKVELFGRRKRAGWTVHGDEVFQNNGSGQDTIECEHLIEHR